MKETILITGGAGMIGSNLAHWLLENTEHDIIIYDDLSGGYLENIPDNYRVVFIDNNDKRRKNNFDACFEYKPTIVYHLAAYAAENLSPFIRCFNYTNNLVATSAVVNACIKHKVKRLVFTSSIAVYGHGNPPFNENQPPSPNDPYGVAKYAAEMDIRIAGEQHGLDYCIVRPYNVYGERQNIWDKYRNVIGIWMYNYINGLPLQIFGDGKQVRGFTYVGDIMKPLYLAATKVECSKQIINLGSDFQYSINELAQTLIEVMGGGEKQYLPARHEVKYAYCDISKCKELLEFKDLTPLREGLTRMFEWAKQQPNRERKEWDNYELETGIYPIYKKEVAI